MKSISLALFYVDFHRFTLKNVNRCCCCYLQVKLQRLNLLMSKTKPFNSDECKFFLRICCAHFEQIEFLLLEGSQSHKSFRFPSFGGQWGSCFLLGTCWSSERGKRFAAAPLDGDGVGATGELNFPSIFLKYDCDCIIRSWRVVFKFPHNFLIFWLLVLFSPGAEWSTGQSTDDALMFLRELHSCDD